LGPHKGDGDLVCDARHFAISCVGCSCMLATHFSSPPLCMTSLPRVSHGARLLLRIPPNYLEPTVHLRGALLELVLRGQETSGKGAIGEAIEDEGPFEHVEDVHGRASLSCRVKILRLIGDAGDRRRGIDREVRANGPGERILDITLGNRVWPVPRKEVDDERDVALRDFVVTSAAGVAIGRDDGRGWGWRIEDTLHLIQRHELIARVHGEVRDARWLGLGGG
jgi:hypothetical protein